MGRGNTAKHRAASIITIAEGWSWAHLALDIPPQFFQNDVIRVATVSGWWHQVRAGPVVVDGDTVEATHLNIEHPV